MPLWIVGVDILRWERPCRAVRAAGPRRVLLRRGEIVAVGDATRCGPQARGYPLERGEIVAVGDATRLAAPAGLLCTRCGPQARGYPLERGEIVAVGDATRLAAPAGLLCTRCGPAARGEFPSFSTFQIFHFPHHSQQFETQSIYDFRFTIYVS